MSNNEDKSLESKSPFFIMLSGMLSFLLLFIFMIAFEFLEIDETTIITLMIILFVYVIVSFIIATYNLISYLEIIQDLKQLHEEKILGLHCQIIIRKKYQDGIINQTKSFIFLTEREERRIIKENLISLKMFEMVLDYKYILIAMGSILEFLLIKYSTFHNIPPADYKKPDGNLIEAKKKHLVNYIQSAINDNLFNQKKKWKFVQSHLRDFRNYVHIAKECVEEKLDKDWYESMRPIFESILKKFES